MTDAEIQAAEIRAWLHVHGFSLRALARRLRREPSLVSRVIRGRARSAPIWGQIHAFMANPAGYVPPMETPPRRLVGIEGAASYLGISPGTVRDLIARGNVRRVRLPAGGRRVLIDIRDLDRLIRYSKVRD